ncbi:MAG: hypothetical protein PHG36_02515 [Dehalococcoidia bacterium]|nr:hypothetical protein [Dehalococcoidia bacterium]
MVLFKASRKACTKMDGMMQKDFEERYLFQELADYSESELVRLLKTHWGYSNTQPFDIIGRMKEISRGREGSFFIIEQLHSTNDRSLLLYPLKESDVQHRVYVGTVNKALLGNESVDGEWVKARVELSPEKERSKHKNPFALKIANGGLQLLQAIPEEVADPEIFIEGEGRVEK